MQNSVLESHSQEKLGACSVQLKGEGCDVKQGRLAEEGDKHRCRRRHTWRRKGCGHPVVQRVLHEVTFVAGPCLHPRHISHLSLKIPGARVGTQQSTRHLKNKGPQLPHVLAIQQSQWQDSLML